MDFARRRLLMIALMLGMCAVTVTVPSTAADAAQVPEIAGSRLPPAQPPQSLRDTGLYRDGSMTEIDPANLAFSPQYPLWSDGAAKRRWINLPPGTFIDAVRPDAWEFPAGTRLWKEFSHAGRRIETRLIQRRADRSWVYAAYVWNDDGSDAQLAPADGVVLDTPQAPAGRYEVPSRSDCLACHEGAAVPVLGVSAVQLSSDRDPQVRAAAQELSPVDMQGLVARGLLRNLPPSLLTHPPRIAAATPTERAALGYLHGNCGHCHNHNGAPAPVRLLLAQTAGAAAESRDRVLNSAVNAPSRFHPPGMPGEPSLFSVPAATGMHNTSPAPRRRGAH